MPVDLAAGIERAAAFPTRFAVDVPHAISPNTRGEWTTTGSTSTWRHALQIPGAVSMSFHASGVRLPDGAVLKTTIGGVEYFYRAKDLHVGELWSRVGRGDTIDFELTLPTKERTALRLDIASVQAGYRSFDSPSRDHPRYRALSLAGTAAAAVDTCVENWACHTTSVNSPPGQATVALLIGNVAQCTGVLLNNVPGDGTPYVLTARHCENGNPDGGTPSAAHQVAVYWNAITPCGQTLGSIYSGGIPVQFGATTIVEQQDAWLIQLDAPPVVNDAYYAGWDATGTAFVGGFTANHGLGGSRQFTGWFGQADFETVPGNVLGVGYTSTFWATVNAVGSISPGASGSGVFDATGHLVATLVRGRSQGSGPDSPGVCPAPSPPAPSPQTATTDSTALSGIFSSTADPKSTTGSVTLQSVLDPAHTGKLVMDGQTQPPFVSLTTSVGTNPQTGFFIHLFWNTKRATSCTASGGGTGDGWAGPQGLSGDVPLTNYDGGDVEYSLTCGDGTRSVTKRVTVHWDLAPPAATIFTPAGVPAYGTPFDIQWSTNLQPCVASGGHAGDGWSGTFISERSLSVTETEIGLVTFTITCGSGSRTASAQTTVFVQAPSASITTDIASIRIGETVHLSVTANGRPCAKTGGSSGDGWAGPLPGTAFFGASYDVTASVPGTYTYAVTCGSGAHVVTAQTNVTFTDGAPSVTLTANPTTAAAALLDRTGGMSVGLTWNSNVRPCAISTTSPLNTIVPSSDFPSGSTVVRSVLLGDVTYQATCGVGPARAQATAVVTYTGTPQVVLGVPSGAVAGSQIQFSVEANVLLPCTATGGSSGDGWGGPVVLSQPAFGGLALQASVPVVENAAGTYTYTITCGSGAQAITAQATMNVIASQPFVSMTVTKLLPVIDEPITITWDSNTSPCKASGGSATDGWEGPLPDSTGSKTLTEHTAGTYFYFVFCGVAPLFASGMVTPNFLLTAPPTLQASATKVSAGQSVTLTWSSSDGSTCNAAGGSGGDGWSGAKAASGTLDVRESGVGTYTYFLACGTSPTVTVQVEFTTAPPAPQPQLPPSVTLTTSATAVTVGDAVTLTYTPANAEACTAAGGSAADGWQTGSLALNGGSQSVKETSAGTYNYSITCTKSGFAAATSTVTVTVNAQVVVPGTPIGGGGSSGGGGGGGSLMLADLLALAGLLVMRRGRRTRATPRYPAPSGIHRMCR